jgi:hypothetical protein
VTGPLAGLGPLTIPNSAAEAGIGWNCEIQTSEFTLTDFLLNSNNNAPALVPQVSCLSSFPLRFLLQLWPMG